ncbi:MAG: helix-turn-helix domain-containing protein [Propylenella sp.]
MTAATTKRRATEIDRKIGARLRGIRREAGWSQERLGASLGMSFQQVQKYENGTNRVAVSTLLLIAEALRRPVTDFLP